MKISPRFSAAGRRWARALLPGIAALLALLTVPAAARDESELPPLRALKAGGLKAEVAALIMSGQEGGEIPIEVLALPLAGAGEKLRVPILIEVAGAALAAEQAEEDPLRFEVYAYALAEDGGLRDSLIQLYEVDLERLGDRLRRSGVKFTGDLDLPPGSYSLRVLVKNPGTDRLGLRILPLEVPAAAPAGGTPEGGTPEGGAPEVRRPVLLPPLFPEPPGGWLSVREARERGAPGREDVALLAARPAAKPVLGLGREQSFRLFAYHLDAVGSEITVEVVGAGGRSLELEARVNSYSAAGEGGLRVLDAAFEPAGLAAGDYQLRALLGSPGGEPIASPLLAVTFAADELAGSGVWAEVDPGLLAATGPASRGPASGSPAETAPAPRRKLRREDVAPIVADYAGVLRALGAGDRSTARSSLFELASTLARDVGTAGLEALASVEADAVRAVAKADPAALVPILELHFELYEEARRRNLPLISTHARNTTLRLVNLYADSGSSPEIRRLASDFLASVGGILQQVDLIRFSGSLFKQALAIDGRNENALLALAVSHEKIGQYKEAIDYLDDLLKVRPDHGEGRLRLAINLIREDRKKAARRHLETLLKGRHRPWVLSLAYQKLADLHLAAGEPETAEELLRQGIARLADDQKLHLQLAFLLDARQERDAARQVLDQLGQRPSRRGTSPRHRYTEWPAEAFAETRRGLIAAAEARTERLGTALGASGWPGERWEAAP